VKIVLDLLQLPASVAAQLGACPSKVVGRDAGNTDCSGILPEHLPDDLLAESFDSNSVAATDGAEYITFRYAARSRPRVDRYLHSRRHGHGPNATVFADKVNDALAAIALLDVCESWPLLRIGGDHSPEERPRWRDRAVLSPSLCLAH